MSTATAALAGLVLAVGTGLAGYGYGIDQGKALEKGRQDASALKMLTDQVTAHADLVKRSSAASRALRAAMAEQERTNTATTRELNHELTQTADSRAGCVFPAGVMRNLADARAQYHDVRHFHALPGAGSGSGAGPPRSSCI